ncbi:hypothetical protein CONPUDRAFT_161827 [Coniophora puteana RWD-64-598 SS2]|uniref:Uncharacterized protein n=1 Tax=Coniophora puteana (strain RWD-64-598) TaxID=741705 RepID=A0A5M3N735_CONPW|nr:uncharacterized protein CONPUDRAFT_161827 [Coniophora puteana RWD-64-598 SS2]EIW87243.1 hypothetical protein CONPUDRAFT_161827 [Coniophora puteana RWD-64-598 SS2]
MAYAFLSLLSSFSLAWLLGHELRISRIGIFSISSPRYRNRRTGLAISCARVQIAFHIPTRTNPRWATFEAFEYEYKDAACHVAVSKTTAVLWLLPVYFGFTSYPLVSTELENFRLRIFTSRETPEWVRQLRANLVASILQGEIIRLDDFFVKMEFAPFTGTTYPSDGEIVRPDGTHGDELDDVRVSAILDEYWTKNWAERLYTFASIEAQFRRSWLAERGSYVMIAKGLKWTKMLTGDEREKRVHTSSWRQLYESLTYLPRNIATIFTDPMHNLDISVPRLDVTFDDFRIRDAELLRQALTLVGIKFRDAGISTSSFMLDAAASILFPSDRDLSRVVQDENFE